MFRKSLLVLIASIAVLVAPPELFAQGKNYGPGVSDHEIKLGQTMPHSGPLSALSAVGKAEVAYFEMLNASGGVNGRKIKLISLDDGYNPAKTVKHARWWKTSMSSRYFHPWVARLTLRFTSTSTTIRFPICLSRRI